MDDNVGKQGIPNHTKGSRHALVLFVIWLVFTAIVLVIGLPIVLESIQQSGVLTLLNATTDTRKTTDQYQAKVWFYTADQGMKAFTQEQTKQGGSSYHDTFESLLSGPKLAAIRMGAVSYINPKTNLRGITLSNRVLYIDLSRQFMESQDLKKAYEQLKRTGKGFSQVKDIILLIEGERATLLDDL